MWRCMQEAVAGALAPQQTGTAERARTPRCAIEKQIFESSERILATQCERCEL